MLAKTAKLASASSYLISRKLNATGRDEVMVKAITNTAGLIEALKRLVGQLFDIVEAQRAGG